MIRSAIILTLVLLYSGSKAQENGPDFVKVDSAFSYYFDVLDSYLRKTDLDRSVRRVQIISNLERLSHIEADGDGTYVGKLDFSKKNLIDWKNWYSSHKQDLVWNNERGRVEGRAIEKSIEFKFEKAVEIAIHSLIEKQRQKDTEVNFYFYLTKGISDHDCDNYKLFVESYVGEPLEYLFEIINTSSRFYLYGQQSIPICLDFDLDFSGSNSKIGGMMLRKSLKGSVNVIEFSRDGKIIKINK